MKRTIDSYFTSLMPLYLNGRLDGLRRRLFLAWLQRRHNAQASLSNLQVLQQSRSTGSEAPSNAVWNRIQAEIRVAGPARAPRPRETWRLGMGLAVFLILLSWFAFPPSIVLEWSVQGSAPEAFHIYRAEPGSEEFRLLEVIPATASQTAYRFVDLQLLPWNEATYRIEAIAGSGVPITSERVVPDAGITLPNQVALLLAAGVLVYGLLVLASTRMLWASPEMHLHAS